MKKNTFRKWLLIITFLLIYLLIIVYFLRKKSEEKWREKFPSLEKGINVNEPKKAKEESKNQVNGMVESWWLTDEEIAYAFQEIEKELSNSSEIKLVSPSVARVIQEGREISEDIKKARWVFFPINNSLEHETAGAGTHWTLLIADKPPGSRFCVFAHYNSSGSNIPTNATKLATNFSEKLGVDKDFFQIYNDYECPQQTNGSDCGVFVIAYTRALARGFQKSAFARNLGLKEQGLIFSIAEERKKLQVVGFPKKVSMTENYNISDDCPYTESEENLILEWYENPDTPLRKKIEWEWDYCSFGLSCSATKSERANSLKEFSKKIRLLSGVSKLAKEKLKKIYQIKKILKDCSLSLAEYEKSKTSAKIDGWVKTSDEFKEINDLYKIHFPGK